MRGTKSLSDILGELITIRGYGRLWVQQILENAWNTAIGEPDCHQTQISEMRRGVLSVTVAHPSLLEELAAFRKGTLLASLRSSALGICDIQFRVGSIGNDARKTTKSSLSRPVHRALKDRRARSESENRFS
jgi:Dna[CI] antecedent, DciA